MSPMRYSRYNLPNGRAVYLTQRPDRASGVRGFIDKTNPGVRFCFTDDLVKSPHVKPWSKIQWHWLPWVAGANIPVENVFAFISMFNHYNEELSLDQSIWLHCDSSSMRAPTYFGLALMALFPMCDESICEAMTVSENFDYDYAQHSRADKYADISLERDPGIDKLVKAWQDGGEELAHKVYQDICEDRDRK